MVSLNSLHPLRYTFNKIIKSKHRDFSEHPTPTIYKLIDVVHFETLKRYSFRYFDMKLYNKHPVLTLKSDPFQLKRSIVHGVWSVSYTSSSRQYSVLSISPLRGKLCVSRIRSKAALELALIDRIQLRAAQRSRRLVDRCSQGIRRRVIVRVQPRKNVRRLHERKLEGKAKGIVALQEVRGSVNATSEILRIDTGEAVGLTRVAANAEEFWML